MQVISKSELEFLESARRQFDKYPHINSFRSPEYVAFRGYVDEIEIYRFDKNYPKVATFGGQIKQGKLKVNNKEEK